VIDFSMGLGSIICVADADEAAARDEAMAAAVTEDLMEIPPLPPITDGCIRAGDDLAGHLFPQGTVTRGGEPSRFDDVFGAGWRLVTVGTDPIDVDASVMSWFAAMGGAVVTIGPDGDALDADGTYARWFGDHGVTGVLQRPDFHIYGTAQSADDAAMLLQDLHHQLAHRTAGS